jgi:hypothetical protein
MASGGRGVGVGFAVGLGVGLAVGLAVGADVGIGVAVPVGVAVAVSVAPVVAVATGVDVSIIAAVGVGLGVGVGVAVAPATVWVGPAVELVQLATTNATPTAMAMRRRHLARPTNAVPREASAGWLDIVVSSQSAPAVQVNPMESLRRGVEAFCQRRGTPDARMDQRPGA